MPLRVYAEQDILLFALDSARRYGDPNPTLVQHARSTRRGAAALLDWGSDDDRTVYVVAIKGQFSVKRASHGPAVPHEVITVPALFRVIDIETGEVIDSGSRPVFPDLRSLGAVITDLAAEAGIPRARPPKISEPPPFRPMRLRGAGPLPNAIEVAYAGAATVGANGSARLHGRAGGLGEMLWQALERAGWKGHMTHIRTTVSIRIGVLTAPSPLPRPHAGLTPLSGGARRLGRRARVDTEGVAWQQYEGPFYDRDGGIAPRLVDRERWPEEFAFGEDLLYTAAVRAGWLSNQPGVIADIPDVRIHLSVTRRESHFDT